jgi:hypothetical protein
VPKSSVKIVGSTWHQVWRQAYLRKWRVGDCGWKKKKLVRYEAFNVRGVKDPRLAKQGCHLTVTKRNDECLQHKLTHPGRKKLNKTRNF